MQISFSALNARLHRKYSKNISPWMVLGVFSIIALLAMFSLIPIWIIDYGPWTTLVSSILIFLMLCVIAMIALQKGIHKSKSVTAIQWSTPSLSRTNTAMEIRYESKSLYEPKLPAEPIVLKKSLLDQIIESIKAFRPSIRYEKEIGYHAELVGWLKTKFPNLQMEPQTGASRPDIVIGDVAIEVKGPTGHLALEGLTTKCLKYLQHYPHLIAVLFEPCFSESHYAEIKKGLELNFPNVIIIRKENYFPYFRENNNHEPGAH